MRGDTQGLVSLFDDMHTQMSRRRVHPEISKRLPFLQADDPAKRECTVTEGLVCRVSDLVKVTRDRSADHSRNKALFQTLAYRGTTTALGFCILAKKSGKVLFNGSAQELAATLRGTPYALVDESEQLLDVAMRYLTHSTKSEKTLHMHTDLRISQVYAKSGYHLGKTNLCLSAKEHPVITMSLRMVGDAALGRGLGHDYAQLIDDASAQTGIPKNLLIGFERTFEATLPEKEQAMAVYVPAGRIAIVDYAYLAEQMECDVGAITKLVDAELVPQSHLFAKHFSQ